MAAVLGIRLLGSRAFTVDGEPWRFVAPPRTIPLLGYLVTATAPIAREVLAVALWPDTDEEEGRANLRRHLHHLQQALPPRAEAWIRSGPDGVLWNGAEAYVDVLEFGRAHAAGDHHAAVASYGGDFLQGYYDDWVIARRDRMTLAFLADLGDLLNEARSVRHYEAAIGYAGRILELDEWREDTVRSLMTVRYEAGDRAGALGTFERFAGRLREEMHAEPMPETMALRDAILRNAPVTVAAREVRALESASAGLPFVGRGDDIERLRELWNAVERRSGRFAFVSGEAGIGKTRLVREFALEVERQGGRVLVGGTSQPEAVPYEPLAEALRSAAEYLSSVKLDPLWTAVLEGVVPELHARSGGASSPEPIGEKQERARLFEAMTRTIAALGETRPFLMILEDVQWASDATVAALDFIARRLAGIRGIVIATYRDEEIDEFAAFDRMQRTLDREHRAAHVRPGRLSQRDVERMLKTPALKDAPPELAGALQRISEGNPLFILQLLGDFSEDGTIPDEDAGPAPNLASTIAARVARLPERTRALAEYAAVAGRTFSVDLLRDATGWNENDVLSELSALMDRHVMRASSDQSRYDYTFSHHLLQRGIYAGIPVHQCARLHRRMALLNDRMARDNPMLAGEVALHWDRAGDATRAARSYVHAAQAALAVYANETARKYALRALELENDKRKRLQAMRVLIAADERLGDKGARESDVAAFLRASEDAGPDARFAALEAAGRHFNIVGNRTEQRACLKEMRDIATRTGDDGKLATALLAEGTMLQGLGDLSEAIPRLREAREASVRAGDGEHALEAGLALVTAIRHRGDPVEAEAELSRVEAGLADDAPLHRRMAVIRTRAFVEMFREDGEAVARLASELGSIARRVGSVEVEAEAQRMLGYAATFQSLDYERMHDAFTAAAAMFERVGAVRQQAAVIADLAAIEVDLGRYANAEPLLERMEALAKDVEWPAGIAYGALNRALIDSGQRRYEKARDYASSALEWAERTDESKARSTALTLLGSIDCALGEYERGLERMREGIALRRTIDEEWSLAADLCLLVDGLLASGDVAGAQSAAAELETIFEAHPDRQMTPANICWTLARVRRASDDDAGYARFVRRGRAALDERCSHIHDAGIRQAMRERTFCRELLTATLPATAQVNVSARRKRSKNSQSSP